ncbi:MAG: selenoneine biosynthesis selenosugar synthase SenB [Gemmataceae bacterium]
MRIGIVTPAPAGSLVGNRITALRWQTLLTRAGYSVEVNTQLDHPAPDVLIALHARKSARTIAEFTGLFPDRPCVLVLTGTDLYEDIHRDPEAARSLELAHRLVVLQPYAINEVPPALRTRVRVIFQSVEPIDLPRLPGDGFTVCVLGHLRPVKDPFRTALAARLLPSHSRIRVLHVGEALTPEMASQAREEERVNRRYHWLGGLPRTEALKHLASSDLFSLTSWMEGGANAVSEAVVLDVPVISSSISGSTGLLGADYPGLFPAGDTEALARLLYQAEIDASFLQSLRQRGRQVNALFSPQEEQKRLEALLAEFGIQAD